MFKKFTYIFVLFLRPTSVQNPNFIYYVSVNLIYGQPLIGRNWESYSKLQQYMVKYSENTETK